MGTITRNVSNQIDLLNGDVEQYADFAKKNLQAYRSLNGYIASRLKELNNEKKYSLSARIGLDKGTINLWELNGVTEMKEAFELAIGLRLDADSVVDFIQKGTGRGIYLADEEHFRYVYILQHLEELEEKYPYGEGETIRQWVQRVKPLLPIQKGVYQGWIETETFKKAVKTGELDLVHILTFRGAGDKAAAFLEEQIKGTPFEENHGNREITDVQLDLGQKNKKDITEKNVSLSQNIFFAQEKSFLDKVMKQLRLGTVPHRYDIIELGMILRLNCEQMNELLELCGENSLYARNIYEGALLSVWKFLSEMSPEWFEEKESFLLWDDLENIEEKERIYKRDYEDEDLMGGPLDFRVLASKQVEEALQGLPKEKFKNVLREKPSWYLNKKERKIRLEQRRISTIFYEMMARIKLIRNRVIEGNRSYSIDDKHIEVWVSKDVTIQMEYSLMAVLDKLEDDYGYDDIDERKDAEILRMMKQLDAEWMSAVKNENVLSYKTEEFTQCKKYFFEKMVDMYDAYFISYVPNLDDFEMKKKEETTEDGCKTAN